MVRLPPETPVTMPVVVVLVTVANAVLLLVQVPPVGELAKVVVKPGQTEVTPVIAEGAVLTVIGNDAVQLVGSV